VGTTEVPRFESNRVEEGCVLVESTTMGTGVVVVLAIIVVS
jgi:hypothetical protein